MKSKMENPETPKRCGWSVIRKAQVIGAVTGALLTIVLLIIAFNLHPPVSQHGDDATALNAQEALEMLTALPIILLCKLFGCESLLGTNSSSGRWIFVGLTIIINSCFFLLVGASIGWLIQNFRWLIQKLMEKTD